MRRLMRTRWLLPMLLIGLAVLLVRLPGTAPDQALADASLPAQNGRTQAEVGAGPAEPMPTRARIDGPATQPGETPEAPQTELDTTSCGTY
jgi:hypothetical protein